jgi:CBS domain-containing protein
MQISALFHKPTTRGDLAAADLTDIRYATLRHMAETVTKPLGDKAMYVERLLPAAREKLVTIAEDAPLTEAAKFLHEGTDLVVVCGGSAGLVAGVITKTDVVGQMGRCQGASCTMPASLTMTRDVVICRPDELLQEVWKRMKERKLKNIPVVGEDSRPMGVLEARDILQVLLEESKDEEAMLRDYVMGIGY